MLSLCFQVHEDRPVYIEEAEESTGRKWINQLPQPRGNSNYTLNLVWRGRYSSDARYNAVWRKAAKGWRPGNLHCTRNNNCIDDNYANKR